jgi:hypothetical protein
MKPERLRGAARKSDAVQRSLGPGIQWMQRPLAGDSLGCVCATSSAALIRAHETKAGAPAHRITRFSAVIDPTTASR